MSTDEILRVAAGDNASALEFLRAFTARAHWLDDLVDRDNPEFQCTAESVAEMEATWLVVLAANPFFVAHRAQLVPAMALALNSWVDSGLPKYEWNRVCDVMKGQWHQVVWLVAYLTGGWTALRSASRHEEFDFEQPASGAAGKGTDGLSGK